MWVLIREATAARNLEALAPLVAEFGPHRLALCTDDREPEHISEVGHMNHVVRTAVELGISPEDALMMATLNPALWHGLRDFGAVAPGYVADLLLLPDLESFEPDVVLKRGAPVEDYPSPAVPEWVRNTVRVAPTASNDFAIPWEGGAARVIGLIEGQIVTDELREEPKVEDGFAVADPERDVLKIAVVERHLGTGQDRPRLRARASGSSAARSRRRSPTTRTTSSSWASTTATWHARWGGSPRPGEGWS